MDGALDGMRRIALILLLSLFAFGCEDENMIVLMSDQTGGSREPSGDADGPGTGEGEDPQSCDDGFEGVTVCVDADFYSTCHDHQWVKMPCPEGMACRGNACIERGGQAEGATEPGENDEPSCGSDASCEVPEPCQKDGTCVLADDGEACEADQACKSGRCVNDICVAAPCTPASCGDDGICGVDGVCQPLCGGACEAFETCLDNACVCEKDKMKCVTGQLSYCDEGHWNALELKCMDGVIYGCEGDEVKEFACDSKMCRQNGTSAECLGNNGADRYCTGWNLGDSFCSDYFHEMRCVCELYFIFLVCDWENVPCDAGVTCQSDGDSGRCGGA